VSLSWQILLLLPLVAKG